MEWFLTNLRDADEDTRRTARLVVLFSLGTCAAGLAALPLIYYVSGVPAAMFLLATSLLTGGAGATVRWTRAPRLIAQFFLFSLWLLLSGSIFLLGGEFQPSLPSYSVLILGATYLAGRWAGIAWTGVSVVTVLLMQLAPAGGGALSDAPPGSVRQLYIVAIVTVLVLVCLFSLLYDRVKSSALDDLRGANLRTRQMLDELGKASQGLARSSEKFLGSRTDDSVGLVGQMMSKARAGQESIELSRQSVAGMIEQYRDIASRVAELSKHSQQILELVSVIDRISDRLDLMALNLGIEAAQSGQAGKQFTILATDMRALAERVVAETGRIKSSLRSVHRQVQQVTESSTLGQELTEESVEKLAFMVRTFDDIYDLMARTERATEEITSDTKGQIDAVRRLVTTATGER